MIEPQDLERELRRVNGVNVVRPPLDELVRRARGRTARHRAVVPVAGAVAVAAVVVAGQLVTQSGGKPVNTTTANVATSPAPAADPGADVTHPSKSSVPGPVFATPTTNVTALYASASALAGAPRCKASNLTVSYVQLPEGMLKWSTTFTLTNTGSSACSLGGYPRLGFQRESGATASATFTDATEAPYGPVVAGMVQSIPEMAFGIAPGASAYFYIASTTGSDGPCDLSHLFTVALRLPADQGAAVLKNFTPASCGIDPQGMISPLTPVPPAS